MFLTLDEANILCQNGNGWRMSPQLLKAVVNNRCINCNLFVGKEHDFSECYTSSRGLKLICGKSLINLPLPTFEEIYDVKAKEGK